MSSLDRLARSLREAGGLVGAAVREAQPLAPSPPEHPSAAAAPKRPLAPSPSQPPSPAAVAAAGPRTRDRAGDYGLVVEMIYEGYLLHYAQARVVCTEDADLALLAGDQLYALGLARLVELGDLAAVSELADVISLTALARAEDDEDLADAVWAAGARAVGWGATPAHEQAKQLAREGAPQAAPTLRAVAAQG